MNRLILAFKTSRDSELAKTGNRVFGGLTNNSFFPDTTLVKVLEKDVQDFQLSLNVSADGGRTSIAVKNAKRQALITTLTQLAYYVMQVSKGNKEMLLSSGFDLAKEKGESISMSAIANVVVETGQPGEASIQVKKVTGARSYMHQYTTEQPTVTTAWTSETSAHRKHKFDGLKSMGLYWFRVVAIGINGQQMISDPVARVVL